MNPTLIVRFTHSCKVPMLWMTCAFIFSVLIPFRVSGQQVPDTAAIISNIQSVSLLGKHYGDSVVLRWAAVKPDIWYAHLHKPVLVARREVAPQPGEYEVISDSIRLMPETDLEAYAASRPDHPLLVVLLQNAYRDWENSLYDGNIANIQEKADNFNNRWSLVLFAADRDPVVAQAAGMRFVDRSVKKGVTYAYKVYVPGQITGIDHKVVHPNIRVFTPMIYQGFQRDSTLVIQWQKHLHDAHYSAYYIERSEDGKSYTRLNALPYVQAFSNDPKLQSHYYTYSDRVANGKTYMYRLIGLDAFGDESKPSIPVSLTAKDLEPPLPAMVEARVDSLRKGVDISWTYPDSADIKSVRVWYAEGGENPVMVSDLLPAQTMTFFHQPDDFNGIAKYMVTTADADGNVSRSLETIIRVPDFVAPAAPVWEETLTDTTGLIRIRWKEAKEEDVIGYFVYAADGEERHFQRLTPKLYPFRQFTDTVALHTLTEKRYYKIIAVDDAMNYSPYSTEIEVDRPDVMPPSPAWIQSYDLTDTSIVLHLVPSSSRDVVRHDIMRKSTSADEWNTLASLTSISADLTYHDATIEPGKMYIYTLLAYDEQGLSSGVVSEKHILTPVRRSTEDHMCHLTRDSDGMPVIAWQHHSGTTGVLIYKQTKSIWKLEKEVSSETGQYKFSQYQDEPLMAKFIYDDGSRSAAILLTH